MSILKCLIDPEHASGRALHLYPPRTFRSKGITLLLIHLGSRQHPLTVWSLSLHPSNKQTNKQANTITAKKQSSCIKSENQWLLIQKILMSQFSLTHFCSMSPSYKRTEIQTLLIFCHQKKKKKKKRIINLKWNPNPMTYLQYSSLS